MEVEEINKQTGHSSYISSTFLDLNNVHVRIENQTNATNKSDLELAGLSGLIYGGVEINNKQPAFL